MNILRPDKLDQFVGQEQAKQLLLRTAEACLGRGDPLPHILLSGPAGHGKTTLAHILASMMGSGIQVVMGPSVSKPHEISGRLVSLEKNDILFIDEVHRVSKKSQEGLYSALEDGKIEWIPEGLKSGVSVDLKPFTLIGATTDPGMLTGPFRDRFGIRIHLKPYSKSEMATLVDQSASKLDLLFYDADIAKVILASRHVPRRANTLLERFRDYVQILSSRNGVMDEVLRDLDITWPGALTYEDRQVLKVLTSETFNGKPVGLATLALASEVDAATIQTVVEPHLMRLGALERTPQGRKASKGAREYLKAS